jgi:hypothetical protein
VGPTSEWPRHKTGMLTPHVLAAHRVAGIVPRVMEETNQSRFQDQRQGIVKATSHMGVEMRDVPSLCVEILSVDFCNYKIIILIIMLLSIRAFPAEL